jgi:cation diffusion facilitator CzcD-associated flavoprotein CzcO
MSAEGTGRDAGESAAAPALHARLPHAAEVVVVGGGASGEALAAALAAKL